MSQSTQRDRLRALFEANLGKPVPLPQILALGISQYGARIHELRRDGYEIVSETVGVIDGQKHTAFTFYGRKLPAMREPSAPPSSRPADLSSDDWYQREHGPRPKENGPDLPLFTGASR